MKRLILLLCILVFVPPCESRSEDVQLARLPPHVVGGVPVAVSSCPSFYNASNVILSWDGDHSSGTNYMCNSSGTAISGVNTNLGISTDYGESGSYGSLHDTPDERIVYTQTSNQYLDPTTAQTLWFRVYLTANPNNTIQWFEASYDGGVNDYMYFVIGTSGQFGAYYSAAGQGVVSAWTDALSPTTWTDIAYSWDPTNGDHAAYPVSGTWNDDNDEITGSIVDGTIYIVHGELYAGMTAADQSLRVTQWALMSGYKRAKPW